MPYVSHGIGGCLFVCVSVRYTLRAYQNDASWDHEMFTGRSQKDFANRISKVLPEIRTGTTGSFRSRALNEKGIKKLAIFNQLVAVS